MENDKNIEQESGQRDNTQQSADSNKQHPNRGGVWVVLGCIFLIWLIIHIVNKVMEKKIYKQYNELMQNEQFRKNFNHFGGSDSGSFNFFDYEK